MRIKPLKIKAEYQKGEKKIRVMHTLTTNQTNRH